MVTRIKTKVTKTKVVKKIIKAKPAPKTVRKAPPASASKEMVVQRKPHQLSHSSSTNRKIQTAEGWKRSMLKKHKIAK